MEAVNHLVLKKKKNEGKKRQGTEDLEEISSIDYTLSGSGHIFSGSRDYLVMRGMEFVMGVISVTKLLVNNFTIRNFLLYLVFLKEKPQRQIIVHH